MSSVKLKDPASWKINKLYGEIQHNRKVTLEKIRSLGKLLNDKKSKIQSFEKWVNENCIFSYRTALQYVRIYRIEKEGFYNPNESFSKNLKAWVEPKEFSQPKKIIERLEKEKTIETIIKKTGFKRKEVSNVIDNIQIPKHTIEVKIPRLDSINEKTISLRLMKHYEQCHELGRNEKLLTMDKKKQMVSEIIKLISGVK